MQLKQDFPVYRKHPDLAYLDSSATALKPQVVIDTVRQFYEDYGVNIHRGVYSLSYEASTAYDAARQTVARFINARPAEVIFTRNATDSLNMLAQMLAPGLKPDDRVLTTPLEHHSSLLPWLSGSLAGKFQLDYVELTETGRITLENFRRALTPQTKIVAITYVSNILGYITPLPEIIAEAHKVGARVIVDAAQAAPHLPLDVKALDCDFLAFSGHKMLAPFGIGVLYGKAAQLAQLTPSDWGGDMNEAVGRDFIDIKQPPAGLEAGTPPIGEAIGLARAIEYLEAVGMERIIAHERHLHQLLLKAMKKIPGIELYNPDAELGIVSFNISGVHPHDAATIFDGYNVALRAGHHCAQLVTQWLACSGGTLRASVYLYNDEADVERFITALKAAVAFFAPFREA